mmetsp:Transcript_41825/g.81992  ORF Transcript_41825/g.81992 Transcript_41825/m.81992 type:complete len:120 (-) Transcript_41825:10-369(-)
MFRVIFGFPARARSPSEKSDRTKNIQKTVWLSTLQLSFSLAYRNTLECMVVPIFECVDVLMMEEDRGGQVKSEDSRREAMVDSGKGADRASTGQKEGERGWREEGLTVDGGRGRTIDGR